MSQCFNAYWPSFVEVTFPAVYQDGTPIDLTNPPVYVVSNTIKQAMNSPTTGHRGGKTFHDTCPAIFASSGDDDPINVDVLDDIALQLAVDYYSYMANGHDIVYNGIVSWNPEGISDCIEYAYEMDEISTRVSTGPLNDYPEEMMHYSLSSGSSSSSSSSSSYSPYYTGSLTLVSDITCVNGVINVYKYTQNYETGLLQNTGGSAFSHTAGCCDCPSSGSATSSSSSHPVSSSTAPVSSSTAPISSSTPPVSSSTAPTSSASMSHVSSIGVESSAGGLGV